MVSPRALVFRPLVKGNEDSGNEIGLSPERAAGRGDCVVFLGKTLNSHRCINGYRRI